MRSISQRLWASGSVWSRRHDHIRRAARQAFDLFHLAEDASQEAWLRAYVELPRLREPAAFAGWLRQVTLSCCSRFVRGRRVPVLPLDLAREVASGERPADDRLIAEELAASVRQAIGALPESQREAVLLYYMSRCSQRQVGTFLGLPETTVKKRL